MTKGDYTVVWAPYYTAHKILRGVLDAYLNTGDERALDLASGLCDWMYARLSKLPKSTLQRMWGIFSSGEFGGLVEAICDVHAITGKAEHLALARLFDLDRLIDSCAAGQDILTGLHANQHIPILTGLVGLHDATGEARYLTRPRTSGAWSCRPGCTASAAPATGSSGEGRGRSPARSTTSTPRPAAPTTCSS